MCQAGLIGDFAIGGGIATVYYTEPLFTYDLDIFYVSQNSDEKIISLSPIYNFLRKKGYRVEKEHIVIGQMPVQFIPVYNNLVKEAVENAHWAKYGKSRVKILRAEYLIAISLQTFRPKDKERIIRLLQEGKVDRKYLGGILQRHHLEEKFVRFMKVYYESEN